MKKFSLLFAGMWLWLLSSTAQVPAYWESLGIGGGGALYSPSVNPADHGEIYMGCDMSGLYHTPDQGAGWATVNFLSIQGGHYACVQFTSDPAIRYAADYTSLAGADCLRPVRSADGGNTWSVLPGNPYGNNPGGYILRIFADYDHPGHVVIADYSTLYYSSDGGTTFHHVYTCISMNAGCHIAGVFFDGNHVYIGTNDGLLVSNDGGQTFAIMAVSGIPAGEYMLSFAGAKQNGSLRFLCLTAANVWSGYTYGDNYWNAMKGVYRMDNAGGTWVSQVAGIAQGVDFPVFAGMAANNTEVAWLAGGSAEGHPVVMKSVNGGPWTHTFLTPDNANITTGWCGYGGDRGGGDAEAPFGFTVAPDDPGTVVMTDYGFAHITTDGGLNWRQQYVDRADANPANAPTPTGKPYRGNGLENTSCWQVLWTDSLHLFAGYSDINGIMSSDGGSRWKFIPGLTQNTVYCLAQHPNGTLYAATSNVHDIYQSTRIYDAQIDAGTGAVFYSTDNGASFSLLHNFNHPVVWIALDPIHPSRLYASVLHHNKATTGGIWVTDNLGAGAASTWTKMANPPICNGHPDVIRVLGNGDLVVSYSARKPTYSSAFTDSSGICYYEQATAQWSYRSHPNMRFWTQDVVIDPNTGSESLWYACVFEGWGTPGIGGTGGLYRTTDRGLTWTRIHDNFRVNSCTVRPMHSDELYFTTETDGLWRTTDATAAQPVFTQVAGYPFRHPLRVFYDPYQDGEVWATSFGNGIRRGTGSAPSAAPGPAGPNETMRAYPDPAGDHISFSTRIPGSPGPEMTVTICSITGEEVLRMTGRPSGGEIRVALHGLAPGVYGYRVFDHNREIGSGKFIKK
ncbi:MAG TPA: hypothetical protein PLK82_01305 [Bacteroidales bacterium]|nr:hypothetical protein [Bacteroidales bacterium]